MCWPKCTSNRVGARLRFVVNIGINIVIPIGVSIEIIVGIILG